MHCFGRRYSLYYMHEMPYIHYIIRYPWTVVRGNGAEIEHHS
jgi:hypothetical protein